MSETVIKNTDSGNNLNHNIKQESAQECTSEKYKNNFRKDNRWSGDYRKNRGGKLSKETYFKYDFYETNPFTFEIFLKDSEIIILAINLLNVILIIGRISNQMGKERNWKLETG